MSHRHHRYSGGHRVHDGSVRLLGATTFPELVERFINCPVAINMPKAEFLALPIEQQKEVKSVAYLTACSFQDYDGPRNDANAYKLELAFFDIDSGDLAKQIWSAPEVLSDQLGDINFILHSTATHTPENPRLRLIVDIDPMECHRHAAVIAHIASLLGVSTKWSGFRESTVLSQPMFRSVVFLGETQPPVILSRTNGRSLTDAEVPEVEALPEGLRKFAAEEFDGDESIEYLPLNVSMDEVRAALEKIDPDCDYREWYETAAALRHQFRTEEEAESAFTMWDEWSAKGSKYTEDGANSTYSKWKSFKPFRPGRPPVTIRTLFHHAIAAGWNITPTLDRLVEEFNQWVSEQNSLSSLSTGFAARVRSLPSLTPLAEHTLCQKIAKRYTILSGVNTTAAVIEKQLRRDIKEQAKVKDDDSCPAWLRPVVYVSGLNQFVNTATMTHYSPEAFNITFNEHLMLEDAEGARPPMLAVDYAANVIKIPKAVAEVYDPRWAGSEPIFTKNGITYLNTYRASYPEPDASKSAEAGRIFTQHLGKLIAEQDYQRIVLDFLAFIVQNPGVKIRWTIVIQSVQGAGKGLIGKAMEGVLGKGNVKPISNTIAASQWNDWATGCQLIIIEELHSSGQNRKSLTDGLKEALSNDDLPINKRNTSASVVENTTNFLCFTNEESALAITSGERRYFVIKSPIREKSQADAMQAEGWFDKLGRLHTDLVAGFRHFLLNHKISEDFKPNGNAPATKYTDEMVADSESSGVSLIRELMEDPEHPYITAEFISVKHLTQQLGCGGPQPARYLRELNFEQICRMRLPGLGYQTQIWAPRGSTEASVKAAIKKITPNQTEL